jgi:transcriptional regulator with XRE-family HTH domain
VTDSIYAEIGEKIRSIREGKLRISQEQLAGRAGISRPTVVNIEKGRQQITVGQLIMFANVLGVMPDELLPSAEKAKRSESLIDVLPADLEPSLRDWVRSL